MFHFQKNKKGKPNTPYCFVYFIKMYKFPKLSLNKIFKNNFGNKIRVEEED